VTDSGRISEKLKIHQEEPTPIRAPWEDMQRDITDLKGYCQRICEDSIKFQTQIPDLQRQISRIVLFQAWFPTAAAIGALLYAVLRR
jgi:hypothetical protein